MSMTIVEIIRDLNVETKPAVTWAIGARVRDLYEGRYGHLPPKELRPKTNGPGTHCFAIYPDNMRALIESVVREYQLEAAKQLTFDGWWGDANATLEQVLDENVKPPEKKKP